MVGVTSCESFVEEYERGTVVSIDFPPDREFVGSLFSVFEELRRDVVSRVAREMFGKVHGCCDSIDESTEELIAVVEKFERVSSVEKSKGLVSALSVNSERKSKLTLRDIANVVARSRRLVGREAASSREAGSGLTIIQTIYPRTNPPTPFRRSSSVLRVEETETWTKEKQYLKERSNRNVFELLRHSFPSAFEFSADLQRHRRCLSVYMHRMRGLGLVEALLGERT